ncbi:alpha/beta hydrolase [Croceivirga radicis]|uniref:Alpha/beta hydrolase n=1 Tax=Croceivirga radicis TaxID=1929488 RepID=A0A1V6LUD4_9FLAO|nr:alpha/beta fold hydrolase [Croceivirga radicis]OQD43783.1 alpha/beta hydrolase [Croceivirga radicis]
MKTLKKIMIWVLAIIGMLVLGYVMGPRVKRPNLKLKSPKVTRDLRKLEKTIKVREKRIKNIKPDNQARIVWADSVPKKTAYSLVYLHGWSASQAEGAPLHTETAKRYGMNLFLPRLAGHGLEEEDPMVNLTADQLILSAKEAIAIGEQIGEKVIVMGTSTGGTLGLYLAKENKAIHSLLLYSPNVEIFDASAKLLSMPWGLQLAKMVKGSDYHEFDTEIELKNQYWTTRYRLEALTHLQALVDETMVPETFAAVTQPVFLGYYYKDELHQDSVVSVPAMLNMFDQLGTAENEKQKWAFPNAANHVMTSYITSKDLTAVKQKTYRFIESVLAIAPKEE